MEREGAALFHGQMIGLSPAEEAMVRVSLFLKGSMRVTLLLVVDKVIDVESLTQALQVLQRRHPVLCCRLTAAEPNSKLDASAKFFLRVDSDLQIPVSASKFAGNVKQERLIDECLAVWSERIDRQPLQLGGSVACVSFLKELLHSSVTRPPLYIVG